MKFAVHLRKLEKNGFTLIEFIVTIAIISIIAAIVSVNYSNLKIQSALNGAVQKMAADIRKAQNLAIVSIKEPGGSVPCGYGIHYASPTSYILFADRDPTNNLLCTGSNKIFDAGEEEVSSINIEQKKIKFFAPFDDILFFPPDPLTFINGANGADYPETQSQIILCFEDDCGAFFKRITVRGTGLVDIE